MDGLGANGSNGSGANGSNESWTNVSNGSGANGFNVADWCLPNCSWVSGSQQDLITGPAARSKFQDT